MITILLIFIMGMFAQADQSHVLESKDSVSFTLRNGSAKSIPLKIPGYMNPNLSPFSNSGVTLDIGQKVFFKYKGKKTLLLVADESLEGKTIRVDKKIMLKKEELQKK